MSFKKEVSTKNPFQQRTVGKKQVVGATSGGGGKRDRDHEKSPRGSGGSRKNILLLVAVDVAVVLIIGRVKVT